MAGPESTAELAVSLGYRSRPPSHFVARLGRTGWLEGWGWTIEDALASLAARACELQPSFLIGRAGRDHASILAWLSARAPVPTLDD